MKKKFYYFFIIVLVIFLVGCWDYEEINDTTMVEGFFIDKENDTYKLYIEAITSDPDSKKISSNIVETKSNTVFSGVRKFVEKYGKVAYWSHSKVMMVDSSYAKEGIIELLDYTVRDSEFRSDIEIVISDDIDGNGFLNLKEINKTTFSLIDDIIHNQNKTGTFISTNVWDFVDLITQKGIEPIAPLLHIKEADSSDNNSELMINGVAVFKGFKMVGKLSGEETIYLLFIKDEIKDYPLSIPNFTQSTDNEGFPVTLEILKSKTKVIPSKKNGDLRININIECDVEIAELGTEEDYIKDREVLEKYLSKYIEENIKNLIDKLQNEYKSDIFGFGLSFKKNKPKIWKTIDDSWDYEFTELEVNVKTDVNITKSALIFKPLKNSSY